MVRPIRPIGLGPKDGDGIRQAARQGPADRIRAVRHRLLKTSLLTAIGVTSTVILGAVGPAAAQVQVTPEFSVTPTKTVTPWVFEMAIGALIIGGLAVLFIAASYLRFAPTFFGRKEAPAAPPGARPANLARSAAPAVAAA